MKWLKRITNRFKKDFIYGLNDERLVREGNAYVGWTGQRIEIDEAGYLITDHISLVKSDTEKMTEEVFWELLGGRGEKITHTTTEHIKISANTLWEWADRIENYGGTIDKTDRQIIFQISEIRRYLNKFEVENGLS